MVREVLNLARGVGPGSRRAIEFRLGQVGDEEISSTLDGGQRYTCGAILAC